MHLTPVSLSDPAGKREGLASSAPITHITKMDSNTHKTLYEASPLGREEEERLLDFTATQLQLAKEGTNPFAAMDWLMEPHPTGSLPLHRAAAAVLLKECLTAGSESNHYKGLKNVARELTANTWGQHYPGDLDVLHASGLEPERFYPMLDAVMDYKKSLTMRP